MESITLDTTKRFFFDGRWPKPVGVAMSEALFAKLASVTDSKVSGAVAMITGIPVITLASLGETEVRVALTPMAWMQLLVEKRREEQKT